MAVDSAGTLQLTGESGPGVAVRVQVEDGHMTITSVDEVLGNWDVADIGIRDRVEGFSIRAEGEELVLIVDDEVGFADEIGLAAATPRLARKVATAHNPEARELVEDYPRDDTRTSNNILAIAFALGGVMVLLGGVFLRPSVTNAAASTTIDLEGTGAFWGAFAVGGLLMVAVAFVLSMGRRWARLVALLVIAGVIGTFGYVISTNEVTGSHVAAYGFIAGGIVVGVSVLFSGSLRTSD